MLTENELWQRIRRLEGQTVYTLDRRRPNRISRVTDAAVEIESRATKVAREDLWVVYDGLYQRSRITGEDLYGDRSILGHPYAGKAGRIIMAVLADAVPEDMEVIRRSRAERLSGIRIRTTTNRMDSL